MGDWRWSALAVVVLVGYYSIERVRSWWSTGAPVENEEDEEGATPGAKGMGGVVVLGDDA